MKFYMLFSFISLIYCKVLFKEKIPNDKNDYQNIKFIVLKEIGNETYVDISNYKITNNLIDYYNLNTGMNFTLRDFKHIYEFASVSRQNSDLLVFHEYTQKDYRLILFKDSVRSPFALSILKMFTKGGESVRGLHFDKSEYMALLLSANRIFNIRDDWGGRTLFEDRWLDSST